MSGSRLIIDLRRQKLEKTGNRVEIRLAAPQMVETFELWPEKTPLPF